jgi:antitoxin component YwqK of YwqJK toxin-antitoxin module
MTEYIEYFTNEKIIKFGNFGVDRIKLKGLLINGKKEGQWIEGYINEFYEYVYKEINYINNELNGPYKIFNDQSNIIEEGNYNSNKLNGRFIRYFYANNTYSDVNKVEKGKYIQKECIYINGKINGLCKEYDLFGLRKEINYINSIKNGKYRDYDEYGIISEECTYVNDLKEGESLRYIDTDIVDYKFIYKNGKIINKIEYEYIRNFNEYILVKENYYNYVNNNLSKKSFNNLFDYEILNTKIYNTDKTIIEEINYKDDKIINHTFYADDGNILEKIIYEDCKIISHTFYN